MSNTTIKSADKIKLLDQMLEDIAGDEYEDFDAADSNASADAKRDGNAEELDVIDLMH